MLLVMKSRASALRLEFPSPSSQKIGLLVGPCWERLSPVRGWRRRFGTEIIAKPKAHTRRDAGPLKRIPPEPQLEQQRHQEKPQRRIPTLCSTTSVFGLRTGRGAISRASRCRKTSKIVELIMNCRNMLKYVEISRRLSNRWSRANK